MIEIIVLNESHRFNFLISASFRFVVHFSIRFVNLRKFKKWNFRRWYYCCARTSFVRISRQRLFHGSTESGCRQQKHLPKKRTKTINNAGWERNTRLLLLFLAAIRFIFFFSFSLYKRLVATHTTFSKFFGVRFWCIRTSMAHASTFHHNVEHWMVSFDFRKI